MRQRLATVDDRALDRARGGAAPSDVQIPRESSEMVKFADDPPAAKWDPYQIEEQNRNIPQEDVTDFLTHG